MTTPGPLSGMAGDVLSRAIEVYRDDAAVAGWLAAQRERLHEPLRIAVAGKVKAGKSTLLNGLVGEQIAPVDAGECTRVVTWYRGAPQSRIVLHPLQGPPAPLPVDRRDGALVIDMQGARAEDVDHLEVDWPSPSLRIATLIDTPGIASMSAEVGQRTLRFLNPDDERPTEADAVVYLMRHLHAADAEFLAAFRDQGLARAASVNSVAVISRADEIGGGRVDAMVSARAVARRYRTDPVLRGLCQNVVAVAGLIAETGRTLRQTEFAALAELARQPREDLEAALLTADRFLRPDAPLARAVPSLSGDDRRRLLRRFGVFGLRLSTTLIRQGTGSPAALAAELVRRSGLTELQEVLDTQFVSRRDLLKARSALLAVHRVLIDVPPDDGGRLAADVERIFIDAHEFAELRLLAELRSQAAALPDALADEGKRLLGEEGATPVQRLGLEPGSGPDALRDAALDALARWQEHAENPMLFRAATDACRVIVRTCEGLLSAVSRG
jgi:hypothetical protein